MTQPSIIVVDDGTILGDHLVEKMIGAKVAVRREIWANADLGNALGFVALQRPPRGDSRAAIQLAVRDWRAVLDAAEAQSARAVMVHHAGALGRADDSARGADDAHIPTYPGEAYFEAPYAAERELGAYLCRGVHAIPVIIGLTVDPSRGDDWGTRSFLETCGYPVSLPARHIDVADAGAVARTIIAALQRGRVGRRYVLGGRQMETDALIKQWQADRIAPPLLSTLAAVTTKLDPDASVHLAPLIKGGIIDSTRARGELGHAPLAPLWSSRSDGVQRK